MTIDVRAGAAYQTRPVRFLELWADHGWRVKVYGIAAAAELPRPELVAAAKAVAGQRLPQPAEADGRHGVGFLTVHDAADSCWVLLDWWTEGHLLHHHVFRAEHSTPAALSPVTDGLTACTWELAVVAHEWDAWLREVFSADSPDIERYLSARLTVDI